MEYKKLKDVATIFISNVDKKTKEGESPVILCNFVDVYRNWAITSSHIDRLMEATANEKEILKYTLHKGDVCITKDSETKDDIGTSTYIADEIEGLLLGYHCALIRPDTDYVDGRYLNAFLQSDFVRRFYEANASGSGQRYTLTLDSIGEIPVPVIPIEKQKSIGKVFSDIDRKIENNNKINDNLHKFAMCYYDYWFTQFDFPDKNGKPYQSYGGCFTNDNTIRRDIPPCFSINHIEDYCEIFTGKKDVNQSKDCGKYRFYSCAPEYRFSDEKIYEGQAILISGNGSYTGRTIFVDTAFDLYQRTYACVPNNNTSQDILIYIYYSLLRYLVPQISGGTHGSAIPYIVRDDIAKMPILFNDSLVTKFVQKVKPVLNKIVMNENENAHLTSLRDWLLPLLMNGQATIS